jgi:hypothetical protein
MHQLSLPVCRQAGVTHLYVLNYYHQLLHQTWHAEQLKTLCVSRFTKMLYALQYKSATQRMLPLLPELVTKKISEKIKMD